MFAKTTKALKFFWQNNQHSAKFLPLAIIFITVALILIFKLLQPEPPVKIMEEKSWAVQTHKLVAGEKSPQLELFGQVESPYTALMTASINADVQSLNVKEGQTVVKDQLLIMLDESDVQLILEQKLADAAELEALINSEKNRNKNDIAALKLEKSLVSLARKKLEREKKTSKTNLTSQSSFDSQKQALQNQQLALKARQLTVTNHPARLAQLKARLTHKRALSKQAEKDLKRATITAPFDGIILSTRVSPGERVRPGEELLKLYSSENMELRAQLPQKFVNIIKHTLEQKISLHGTVKTNHGDIGVVLHRISGAMAETGIGVDALFEINNEDADLFIIGEVLPLTLYLPAIPDVYSLPVSSIYGTNRIYLVNDARLTAVTVEKLGGQIKQGKQFILVRSNKLNPGDEIISTQLPHAVSGLKVEVRNAPATFHQQSTAAERP